MVQFGKRLEPLGRILDGQPVKWQLASGLCQLNQGAAGVRLGEAMLGAGFADIQIERCAPVVRVECLHAQCVVQQVTGLELAADGQKAFGDVQAVGGQVIGERLAHAAGAFLVAQELVGAWRRAAGVGGLRRQQFTQCFLSQCFLFRFAHQAFNHFHLVVVADSYDAPGECHFLGVIFEAPLGGVFCVGEFTFEHVKAVALCVGPLIVFIFELFQLLCNSVNLRLDGVCFVAGVPLDALHEKVLWRVDGDLRPVPVLAEFGGGTLEFRDREVNQEFAVVEINHFFEEIVAHWATGFNVGLFADEGAKAAGAGFGLTA